MIELISRDLKYSLEEREKFCQSMLSCSSGAVFLNTCNRVEIYSGQGAIPLAIMKHLFRVTAGLESALPGETAIQAQVKEAYLKASQKTKLSKEMHHLFQNALRVGKRVRTETKISQGAMSHSLAILEILKQDQIAINQARVLIIGLGQINQRVLEYLYKHQCRMIFMANRTYEKTKSISKKYQAEALKFKELYSKLQAVDIVISATAAPHLIIKKEHFKASHLVYMFDLAVPRDIDPEISLLKNVRLFNIEDIEKRILVNKLNRNKIMKEAERIIEEEIKKYDI